MGTQIQSRPTGADRFGSPVGVNNFSIIAATVNGSGSQTANSAILRALFKMGVTVTGKNLFPSNIQGLPTWYITRLSSQGYTGRRETAEVLVAMNRTTADDDIAKVPAGGMVIYPVEWKLQETRTDVTYYALPVQQLAKASGAAPKMVSYVANMAYVGALIHLLGIEEQEIDNALMYHFNGKRKAVDLNMGVVRAAIQHCQENFTADANSPFQVRRVAGNENKVLIEGNTAGALGTCFGGFTFAAWYPITPSTSLVDALGDYAKELRVDADGTHNYAIVQAEDEIAAIGMITGAGWAGARAMTSTSGPGISLMTEYAGLAYFTEIPIVVWDIMRMGPSTGLPTRVSQGDVLPTYYLGHGDTRHIVLLPGSMQECFQFGWQSLDLAERLQTPVFVLSDLDLGMNIWMTDPFQYPDKPLDRGKVLTAAQLDEAKGFNRYEDVDGDGIGYRTVPGTPSKYAAYFTRGSGHNKYAQYTERSEEWEANLDRLHKKHEFARTIVPTPVMDEVAGAEVGIIAYGSTDQGMAEARAFLAERGVKTSYLRIRALPTTESIHEFIRKYPRLYVVENNYDGQMRKILQTEVPERAKDLVQVAKCDGMPLSAEWIAQSILKGEQR